MRKYSIRNNIIRIYFNKSFETNKDDTLNNNFKTVVKEFMTCLDNLNVWSQSNLEDNIKEFVERKKIKFSLLGQNIRYILTNKKSGPPIYAIIDILGKENTFIRLNKYIKRNL